MVHYQLQDVARRITQPPRLLSPSSMGRHARQTRGRITPKPKMGWAWRGSGELLQTLSEALIHLGSIFLHPSLMTSRGRVPLSSSKGSGSWSLVQLSRSLGHTHPPSLHTGTRRLKVPSVNEKGETNITGNYHSSEDIKDRIKYATKK